MSETDVTPIPEADRTAALPDSDIGREYVVRCPRCATAYASWQRGRRMVQGTWTGKGWTDLIAVDGGEGRCEHLQDQDAVDSIRVSLAAIRRQERQRQRDAAAAAAATP